MSHSLLFIISENPLFQPSQNMIDKLSRQRVTIHRMPLLLQVYSVSILIMNFPLLKILRIQKTGLQLHLCRQLTLWLHSCKAGDFTQPNENVMSREFPFLLTESVILIPKVLTEESVLIVTTS